MRMYDLIEKKKNGSALSAEEIRWMVLSYTKGEIPDYQMSAMAMAICFVGLDDEETLELTLAMRDSGDSLDLSQIEGITADKHSTGGVGDKTTLTLAPVIACLGVPMAKMSGRGLGFTGGTIDKLECFPGFTAALDEETFIKNVNSLKLAVVSQTANLVPADKKLYALRDVTATVDQMSLIAGSIMSKKLASGSDIIVLDVKTGSGAFMKTLSEAQKLAETMVRIGIMARKKPAAVVTDMDQPLGNAVGNTLEVVEAIDALSGNGPKDFMEVVYALGSKILTLAGVSSNESEALHMMQKCIASGAAKQKFADFIAAQDGDASYVWDTEKFPKTSYALSVCAPREGYIKSVDAHGVGAACMRLGGGRETKDSPIDLSVGVYLKKKRGDYAKKGEPLAVVYANSETKGKSAVRQVQKAYQITDEKTKPVPMIKRIVDGVPK